jgi:ribonuclease R
MNEQGAITRIYIPPRLEAHRLIEEMMIAANVCAAETLETRQVPLLFRVHDAPPPERMHALADFIKPLGARLDLGQPVVPALFNRIMVKARDSEHYPTISEAVLRTQSQAVYTPENIGHFGLNLGRYAHFTSPIRRYADLIVHRALIRALKLGKDGLTDAEIEKLPAIAEAVSATERRAMIAERTAADRYLSAFMSDQIGECFNGQISGVSRAGLFVKLDGTGADGLVPISRLGAERFFVDDDKLSLVGGTTGTVFRIGQPVEIRLMEATPLQGGLLFSLEDYASFPNAKGRKIRRGPATSRRPHANKRRKNSRKTGRRK